MNETTVSLRIDPEFKSLVPPLGDSEREQLEQSLKAEGCRDPLVIWRGYILDGHNRYEICTEHDIDFGISPIDLPNREAAKEWILRHQFTRRNLNAYQRSILALELEPYEAKKAAERRIHANISGDVTNLAQGRTREIIAKIAGVSQGVLDKVKIIRDYGTIKEKEKLQAGKATINAVANAIKKRQRPEVVDPHISIEPDDHVKLASELTGLAVTVKELIEKYKDGKASTELKALSSVLVGISRARAVMDENYRMSGEHYNPMVYWPEGKE